MDDERETIVTMIGGRMIETNAATRVTVIYPPPEGGKAVVCSHRDGEDILEAHSRMVCRAEQLSRMVGAAI